MVLVKGYTVLPSEGELAEWYVGSVQRIFPGKNYENLQIAVLSLTRGIILSESSNRHRGVTTVDIKAFAAMPRGCQIPFRFLARASEIFVSGNTRIVEIQVKIDTDYEIDKKQCGEEQ